MTTAQLINQLQSWQAIHGICPVIFQQSAGLSVEHEVKGCAVAEDEHGSMAVILFNTFEMTND